jgi:outer membrane protein
MPLCHQGAAIRNLATSTFRKARFLLSLSVLSSFMLVGTEAIGVDNFSSALRDAVGSDPQLRAAIYAKDSALEKRPQGRAGLLPTFEIYGTADQNKTKYSVLNSPANIATIYSRFPSSYFQARLTQPIFRWENLVAYWQSDYDVMAAEKQFEKDYQDFILRTARVCLDLASAQESLVAARQQVSALVEQHRIASKSHEIGIGNITELRESEARLEIGRAQEISAKRELALAKANFRAVVGRSDQGISELKGNAQLGLPFPNVEDTWIEKAFANSPEILRKQAIFEKARLEIEKRRAGHYPTVDAVLVGHQDRSTQTAATFEGFNETKFSAGIQVSFPIFSGFSVISKVREAESNSFKAAEEVEYSRRTASSDITEAFGKVTDGIQEYETYLRALESSKKSVEANRLGYRVGVRSNIDVLNAEQQVFSTTLRAIKAKNDIVYYSLKLKALAGELDETALKELDQQVN